MVVATQLAAALANLNAPEPPSVEEVLRTLEKADLLTLAGWDVAAILGLAAGGIELSSDERAAIVPTGGFGAMNVSLSASPDEGMLVHYPILALYVVVDPTTGRPSETHDAVQLLKVAWYIRYRIDALLYLPPEMRQERLSSDAAWLGVERDRLLALSRWFPAVEAVGSSPQRA